jgi:hypothetical protein
VVWDYLIVGLLLLHHIRSLANVTMATIAIGKVGRLVLPRTSCSFLWQHSEEYFLPFHSNHIQSVTFKFIYMFMWHSMLSVSHEDILLQTDSAHIFVSYNLHANEAHQQHWCMVII